MARHSNLSVSKQDSQIYEEDVHKQNKRGGEHKRDTQAFKLDYDANLLIYYLTSGPAGMVLNEAQGGMICLKLFWISPYTH